MKHQLLSVVALIGTAGIATGMQSVSSAEPLGKQLPCAGSVRDQAGGACLQASSTPTLGALYPLSSDLFVDPITGWIGLGKTNPASRLDVLGNVDVRGSLALGRINDGIQFSTWNPYFVSPTPMLTMFDSGTSNLDRMIVGHSPSYPNYGLCYRDATDQFVFQSSPAVPTLTVDIGTKVDITVDTDISGHLQVSGDRYFEPVLDVLSTYSGNVFDVVNIERTDLAYSLNNVLHLQVPAGSSSTAQLIQADRGGDIEFRVDGDGAIFSDVGITTPADFAEMIEVTTGAESVEPGDVVAIDPLHPRSVHISTVSHSSLVMGVYSTKPGVVGSEREWDMPAAPASEAFLADERLTLKRSDMAELYDEVPVAVVGIVPTKVSAENGPIRPGDLLVTSDTPGHAMRADDPKAGTILGKALGSQNEGTGVIRVLVTLQ